MLFNSLSYVIFLPLVFIFYWVFPHKFRWLLLLLASYYFYMSWNAKYVVIILFVTFISYISAIAIDKSARIITKRLLLFISLVCCLSVLFVFKYFNFISESLSQLLSRFAIYSNPYTLKLLLPVGVSFYTFQTISYVIDVYHGKIKPEVNLGYYATFISFFPQLVAGPIERTTSLLPQIKKEHTFEYNKAIDGAVLILWGYYKKLVIADNIGKYVDRVYSDFPSYTNLDFLIAIIFFSIQIYCDFSGYSDIAIGTARLLGIDLTINFRTPYFSSSIKEFWTRWHISLSSWFRDYLYIPLGGNRCSKLKNCFNVMVTFLVSGLWHGANWNFVIWGGIHGAAHVFENSFDKFFASFRTKRIGRCIMMFIVFIFCNLAWVFFRAKTFSDAIYVINKGLLVFTNPLHFLASNMLSLEDLVLIFIYILILFVHDLLVYSNIDIYKNIGRYGDKLRFITLAAIGIMIVFCSPKGMPAEFVYFQF